MSEKLVFGAIDEICQRFTVDTRMPVGRDETTERGTGGHTRAIRLVRRGRRRRSFRVIRQSSRAETVNRVFRKDETERLRGHGESDGDGRCRRRLGAGRAARQRKEIN